MQPPVQPATDADDPADAPRNKYGRSKLDGERRCAAAAAAGLPCVVVRVARCFPEDVLPDSVTQAAAALSTANLKVRFPVDLSHFESYFSVIIESRQCCKLSWL